MGIKGVFINFSAKVRIGFIDRGYGRQYFKQSQNPAVRAAAFCANMNSETKLYQLAAAILTDCLEGNDINEPATAVYERHLSRFFRLDKWEKKDLAVILLESANAKDDSAYAVAVSNLLNRLNLS